MRKVRSRPRDTLTIDVSPARTAPSRTPYTKPTNPYLRSVRRVGVRRRQWGAEKVNLRGECALFHLFVPTKIERLIRRIFETSVLLSKVAGTGDVTAEVCTVENKA
jgi:hypothetical protein